MEIDLNKLPKRIQSRIRDLIEYSKTIPRGISLVRSVEDIAIIYYLHKYWNMSYSDIALLFNSSKSTIYRIFNDLRLGYTTVYDPNQKQYVRIEINENLLETTLEQIAKTKSIEIRDLTESEIWNKFKANPVRRDRRGYYTKDQVDQTKRALEKIINYINTHRTELEQKFQIVSNNPDNWSREFVEHVVLAYCEEIDKTRGKLFDKCKSQLFIPIRRIPEFYNYGDGLCGSASNIIEPRSTDEVITLNEYKRLLEYCKNTNDVKEKALCDIMIIHIATGSREYGNLTKTGSLSLDDDQLQSSLIGITWNNVVFNNDKMEISIYESKTRKTWRLIYSDLFIPRSYINHYKRLKEYAIKNKYKHVVYTILQYYNIDTIKTVNDFANWYQHNVKKLTSKLFNKRLSPHDLRASHISILAEYKIPLEIAVSNHTGFGVGWEDLKTAVIFYLRFSEHLVNEYYERAKRIANNVLF